MRAFGAKGYVSEAALKRSAAFIAKCRKTKHEQERAQIAALSNQDIQKIMARKIVEAATARSTVSIIDFKQAGIPEHRVAQNLDAAFRLARKQEPRLDAMGAQPWTA